MAAEMEELITACDAVAVADVNLKRKSTNRGYRNASDLAYANLREELGDCYWYGSLLIDELRLGTHEQAIQIAMEMAGYKFPTERSLLVQALICISSVMLDAFKAQMYYGKVLDKSEIFASTGVCLCILHNLCNAYNTTVPEVLAANAAKLKARYPNGFTTDKAKNRDYDAEADAAKETKQPEK